MSAGTEAAAPTPREVVELSLLPHGTVPLAHLYDAANLLGVPDQTLRLALRRLAASGLVEQHGRGRAGLLTATATSRRRAALDEAYWDVAVRQDAGEIVWDGMWHLVAFSVPEARRADRDRLRGVLARLGAAPLAPGLCVSPHDLGPAIEAETEGAVRAYLTTAASREVRHGGRPLAALVPALWPLDDLAAAYRRLLAVTEAWSGRAGSGDPAAVLAAHVAVHAALERALGPDPLLPPELLPPDWPGPEARARVARDWLPGA